MGKRSSKKKKEKVVVTDLPELPPDIGTVTVNPPEIDLDSSVTDVKVVSEPAEAEPPTEEEAETLEEPPETKPSDTVKMEVLISSLKCADGRSFQKGETFEVSKQQLHLYEGQIRDGNVKVTG